MLSTEYSVQINGITLFRDHADKRKYYYLPKGDIHIADNGKKLNYFAYVDSSMSDTLEQQGGFLTFEVELGPSDEELEELKTHFPELLKYAKNQAIAEKRAKGEPFAESDWDKEMDAEENNLSASDFVLAPVPFKEGNVSLCVLGEDGSSRIKIVGSQKPSLFGKQTAVFSVRLEGKDADLMYQMLNVSKKDNDGVAPTEKDDKYINSHIAVVYDLTFKGIEPAHYVKITVDFKAVENYWNHHFSLDGDFTYGSSKAKKDGSDSSKNNISVAADVEVDVMFRELINEGSIVVQQIDFTGNDVGSPLSGDPTAINLVKSLMSSEIFKVSAPPPETNSAIKDVANAASSVASGIASATGNGKPAESGNATGNGKPAESGNATGNGKPAESGNGNASAEATAKAPASSTNENLQSSKKTSEKSGDASTNNKAGGPKDGFPEFLTVAGEDHLITKDEWLKGGFKEDDFKKYAVKYVAFDSFLRYYKTKIVSQDKKDREQQFEKKFKEVAHDSLINQKEWVDQKYTLDDFKKYAKSYMTKSDFQKFYNNNSSVFEKGSIPKCLWDAILEIAPGTCSEETASQSGDQNRTVDEIFAAIAGSDNLITLDEWVKKDLKKNYFTENAVLYVTKSGFREYYNAKIAPLSDEEQTEKAAKELFDKIAGEDNVISESEWEKADKLISDCFAEFSKDFIDKEQYEKFKKENGSDDKEDDDGDDKKDDNDKKDDEDKKDDDGKKDDKDGVPSTVSAMDWKFDVKLGYTYKKRELKETVKRTYIFNKQTAVDHIIHPSGMLTVDGTDFDVDKQVTVGRLGEGPFRNHEIYFGSALDFDTYHLEKILIDVDHIDSTGTVIELTKDKTSDTIHFISERFKVAADNEDEQTEEAKQNAYKAGDKLSYRVSFIFKPLTIKGYDNEDRVLIKTAEKYTSSKAIMIGPEDIDGVYALDIQTGSLTLGENIKSATFSLIQAEEGEDEHSIYNQKLESDTDKIILLNPDKKYKARVQYNLESTFDNIAVTKKDFTYTTDELKAKELVIQDPTAGMVKITTADGEDSFEEISSIEVTLKTEDGREKDIILRKKKPEYYFVTDYTAGDPKVVTVESVVVNYNDDSSEELKISERRKKFYTDATEYVLNI